MSRITQTVQIEKGETPIGKAAEIAYQALMDTLTEYQNSSPEDDLSEPSCLKTATFEIKGVQISVCVGIGPYAKNVLTALESL